MMQDSLIIQHVNTDTDYLPLNRTDSRRASLNHHSRPQCISSTSFLFQFDWFIELISVLVDIDSDYLYHPIIHDIQLRNNLSTTLLASCLLFLL